MKWKEASEGRREKKNVTNEQTLTDSVLCAQCLQSYIVQCCCCFFFSSLLVRYILLLETRELVM